MRIKKKKQVKSLTDLENEFMVTGGKSWGGRIVREFETDMYVHTAIFKMDNQQGPNV